jgi:alpha-glucosidase
MRRFADGAPAEIPSRTPVEVSTEIVTAQSRLDVAMAPSGGQALILEKP